jgi:hypothetical protein
VGLVAGNWVRTVAWTLAFLLLLAACDLSRAPVVDTQAGRVSLAVRFARRSHFSQDSRDPGASRDCTNRAQCASRPSVRSRSRRAG